MNLDWVPPWVWTILIAIVTTVVVEYAAKPRLEARKARLLRDRTQIDEVIFAMQGLAMQLGGLLTVPTGATTPLQFAIYTEQVKEISAAASAARTAISRLSPWFAMNHAAHVGRTVGYLAYIEGLARSTLEGASGGDAALRDAGGQLDKFDVYFRVFVGLHDSQEPWIKRAFWRAATRRTYERQSAATVEAIGLRPPAGE